MNVVIRIIMIVMLNANLGNYCRAKQSEVKQKKKKL